MYYSVWAPLVALATFNNKSQARIVVRNVLASPRLETLKKMDANLVYSFVTKAHSSSAFK
jgi:hypothetical protein